MIGRTLSHYRVTGELSRGGMGVVYSAVDLKLDREVALKVLSPALLGDAELRRRFVQEARAAGALQHPSIAVVHEIDEADGVAFIAMEKIAGERLGDRLAAGGLDVAARLELAIEVAEGLVEAHRKGVVHRDLKPSNILVSDSGHAKLIDFGLAKLLHPLGSLANQVETPARGATDPGRILGTTAYMSPEQARGEEIDRRSDVFSFGCVLHEMLAGAQAFARPHAIETLHAIMKDPAPRLPPLPGVGEALRHELQELVDLCLEKDRDERWQAMAEVLGQLRAIERQLAAQPVAAAGVSKAVAEPGVATPLRVAIVDDEELARGVVREYLAGEPGVEVVAECRNGFEAVKAAAELRPDLMFLDVQMPKLNGFEVLELIGPRVGVVFVTAYDEHALRAFDVHAIDYLLKPVGRERFREALERARHRLRRPVPLPVAELVQAARPGSGHAERILVREGAKVHVIPVEKLDYAQAQDDYVSLHAGGRELLKEQTLAELERSLDPSRFVRIHRSYVLNLERLAKLELYAKDSRVAILTDGTKLPVSRAGYSRLRSLL
jgi:two-component system LytT family response regulator